MVEPQQIPIREEADIVIARKYGRDVAQKIGFRTIECVQIATGISELARNIFLYAKTGTVSVAVLYDKGVARGIEVVAADSGPGIENLELALQDGYTTSGGLGLGLPGTRRLFDDFQIESAPGKGTTVRVHKHLGRR